MAYQNAAYDLSRYEKQLAAQPRLQVVENTEAKPAKGGHWVRLFFLMAAAVMVVAAIINSQVRLTEMSHLVAEEKAKLVELQSENVRLQSELEGKMSIKTLESQAVNELGMSKVDNSQITYLNMSEGDQVYCAAADAAENGSLWSKICNWTASFLHMSE